MKKKILFCLMIMTLLILAFGVINASAGTYGDLTYRISNNKVTITDCATDATEVVIPATIEGKIVTSIGSGAFRDCKILESITIPGGVTSIDYMSFYGCSSLESITIPDSVTTIGNYAFYGCSSLKSITIPGGVTTIGNYAFRNCSNLESITIPDGVTTIGEYAFSGCSSLESVYITDIEAWCRIAFGYSSSNPLYYGANLYVNGELVTDLVIPDSVTTIGEYAFLGCSSLKSITIPDSVTEIGYGAFEDCSGLTSVYITDIEAWCNIAFEGFYSNPLSNGANLYLNGELVTDLVIPDGVTTIGDYAFFGCSSLKSITIPDSVTSIGENAFWDCSSLKSVYITDIKAWCNINFMPWGDSNPLSNGANLYLNGELVTDLVIPEDVTSIVDWAFYGCTSLKSITIPKNVTYVGGYALSGCDNLKSIYIENLEGLCGNYYMEAYASPLYGGADLYLNGELVTDLVFPDIDRYIGGFVFAGYQKLKNVTISDGVTSIGWGMFSGCKNLESVTIPDSVTSIGDWAFEGCSSLKSITIPDGVTYIGERVFDYCTGLKSIAIPKSVTQIIFAAFSGCSSLTDVYYAGSEEEWAQIEFGEYNECLTNATIHYNSVPKVEKVSPYKINSVTLSNLAGVHETIPNDDFFVTVSFTKVSSDKNAIVVLAEYTQSGALKDLTYLSAKDMAIGDTREYPWDIDNKDGTTAKIAIYILESFATIRPLANAVTVCK